MARSASESFVEEPNPDQAAIIFAVVYKIQNGVLQKIQA
jgi:hypothetical protein